MREVILVRFSDYGIKDGVQEFVANVALPGKFQKEIFGASREELNKGIQKIFDELFTTLDIPEKVVRQLPVFTDSEGRPQPMSPFAGTAKVTFNAQVIRGGKVVDD
jgi:hypothetical protein